MQVFHAVALEAKHTVRVPPLRNGLIEPVHNVATVELSAVVIEGIRYELHTIESVKLPLGKYWYSVVQNCKVSSFIL